MALERSSRPGAIVVPGRTGSLALEALTPQARLSRWDGARVAA